MSRNIFIGLLLLSLIIPLVTFADSRTRIVTTKDMSEQDYQRAQKLFEVGEPGAAVAILESLISTYPKSDAAFKAAIYIGKLFLKQDQPDKALDVIEKYRTEYFTMNPDRITELNKVVIQLKAKQVELAQKNLAVKNPVPVLEIALSNSSIEIIPLVHIEYPLSASTIGVILPLTGPYAVYGTRVLTAVQMALNMPMQKFAGSPLMVQTSGRLTLVIGDSQANASTAESLVTSMLSSYHVVAILGEFLVEQAQAVAKKAQEAGVVNLSLSRQIGLPQTGDWIFREALTSDHQTQALVEKMIKLKGIKKFAVLYPEHPYGIEMKNSFLNQVKRQGGEVTVAVPYKPETTTFTGYVGKLSKKSSSSNVKYLECIKSSSSNAKSVSGDEKCKNFLVPAVDFGALFLPDYSKEISYIVPALAAQDFLISQNEGLIKSFHNRAPDIKPIQLLGTSIWDGDFLATRLGSKLDGALFVDGVNWNSSHPQMRTFITEFKTKVGSPPTLLDAQAYDAASILRFLLNNFDSKTQIKNRLDLQKQLKNLKNFAGLTGFISFDGSGDSTAELHWFTFEKNKFRAL
ncbi:MAG: ABC transporter substrate-binding protein [bacterium]|nr:ABC transporter substrate-binding protein [bacterium]